MYKQQCKENYTYLLVKISFNLYSLIDSYLNIDMSNSQEFNPKA